MDRTSSLIKHLFPICSCVFILMLTGIASYAFADDTNIFKLGVPFQVSFNQTATIGQELKIKFANLTQDSRCPSDVTCVWQGQATILIDIEKNDKDLGNFTLTTLNDKNSKVQTFDHYHIELMKVDPYPSTIKKIQLADYIATLKLSLLSPLKQFRSGTSPEKVTCLQDLVLIIKSEDNSPACVKPQTADKLVERGWSQTSFLSNR